jgi:hypothetical protein
MILKTETNLRFQLMFRIHIFWIRIYPGCLVNLMSDLDLDLGFDDQNLNKFSDKGLVPQSKQASSTSNTNISFLLSSFFLPAWILLSTSLKDIYWDSI